MTNIYAFGILHFWNNTFPFSYKVGFEQRAVLQDEFLKLERQQKVKDSRF